MDNVLKLINSLNLEENETVVVACSGGPDSMFLLHYLNNLNLNLVCAHVNHKMREASEYEYEFMKKYCNDNSIIFEGTEILEYNDDNFHDYARTFRYNFFESLLKKYNAKYLFTAHHGDDLMETILMRLVRGTTLKGYAGFKAIVDCGNYKIVRPLIYLTKDEIENMDKIENIPYVVDESNLEDHYTRNRYRHTVLPFLKSEDSNVHTKFLNFSNTINEVDDYFNITINKIKKDIYKSNELDLESFNNLEKLIQRLLLESIISEWYIDDLFLINNNHIDEIFKLIKSDKKNSSCVLPNNLKVIREYNKLIFTREVDDNLKLDSELIDSVDTIIGCIKYVDSSSDTSNYTIRLNSKDIDLPIRVINREIGLKMKVKNMDGSKKINDIFIDMKIPKSKRDVWPIVVDSNNKVLWLPGLKKSDLDIVINGDYDIILSVEKKESFENE